MTTRTQHTPGPVQLVGSMSLGLSLHGVLPNGSTAILPICTMDYRWPPEDVSTQEANAARIVLTWNCHADLVAALHDIRRVLVRLPRNADERLRTLTLTDAALAKAGA